MMKRSFFPKIAWNNIKKNYRFFIPRVLAETGLLGVFYIIFTLKNDQRVQELRGGEYLGVFMSIGTAVIALLSVILMVYTNSFLMKQRRRELGLYNVLGMEKRHISRVLFHETLISSMISIMTGLLLGVLFYKVCSLLICRLLNDDIIFGFYFIKAETMVGAALFFALIDLFTFACNTIGIARMKPVEMLGSRSIGEREPKVKWPMLIIGVLSLGGGYYISITTKQPLQALLLFFVAVILVIIGTYFLFVTGSIFVLKLLKNNPEYYYQKKHMPAVSGLLYRMKQNAVGLASICILATGVLVMISTTVSLYAGMEDTLNQHYPQHYYVSAGYRDSDDSDKIMTMDSEKLKEIIRTNASKQSADIQSMKVEHYLGVTYSYKDGELKTDRASVNVEGNLAGLSSFTFITEDTYVALGGERLGLKADECAVCPIAFSDSYREKSVKLAGKDFTIRTILPTFPINSPMISSVNCYGMVVADDAVLEMIYDDQMKAYGDNASEYEDRISVTFADIESVCEAGKALDEGIQADKKVYLQSLCDFDIYLCANDSYWDARDSVYGMYGTLLFFGLLLGAVCLFATTLIIYYKQISEGYEDRERFQIMQKIGMSGEEVRKTINSQVLLVFFLPLIAAGVHLLFAFPILERLLHMLLLTDTKLFVICSLIVYALFALVYVRIYSGTARTYYKIVR